MPKALTRWQAHVQKWSNCEECLLCQRRSRVVLARGKIPCDILFIGEAPGVSEDVLGRPFAGPAGALLDQIVERAIGDKYRIAFTNLVGCIPLGEDNSKTEEPPKEAILACSPRLVEMICLSKPRAVVKVGKLAVKWMPHDVLGDTLLEYRETEIVHPAAILRMDISQKGLVIQRCVVTLEDLVSELDEEQS